MLCDSKINHKQTVLTVSMCVYVCNQSELFSLSRLSEMGSCKLNIPVPDPKLFNHEVLID